MNQPTFEQLDADQSRTIEQLKQLVEALMSRESRQASEENQSLAAILTHLKLRLSQLEQDQQALRTSVRELCNLILKQAPAHRA
jgi:hypothetical protein